MIIKNILDYRHLPSCVVFSRSRSQLSIICGLFSEIEDLLPSVRKVVTKTHQNIPEEKPPRAEIKPTVILAREEVPVVREIESAEKPILNEEVAMATIAPSPTPAAQYKIIVNAANIRTGPGLTFSVLSTAKRSSLLTELVTDDTRSWSNFILEDGRRGWVGSTVIEPVGTIDHIEIAVTIPAAADTTG